MRYDLDSTIRNSHEPDTTLQRLPIIEFDAIKQRIGPSPFFYNLNSQYLYYWRDDGSRTQRLDARAVHISLPEISVRVSAEHAVSVHRNDRESPSRKLVSEIMIKANQTMAKALTNGNQPMGAVAVADGVYDLAGASLRIEAPNVTLRSQSGSREAVILDGNYATTEIVQITASNVTVAVSES